MKFQAAATFSLAISVDSALVRVAGRDLANCSRQFSEGKYKICRKGTTKCLNMQNMSRVREQTYSSSDEAFHWNLEHSELQDGRDRVKFKNVKYAHYMVAKDIEGDDGTSNFKLWTSGSCGSPGSGSSGGTVKIGYESCNFFGCDSDWLNNGNDWAAKTGSGDRYAIREV